MQEDLTAATEMVASLEKRATEAEGKVMKGEQKIQHLEDEVLHFVHSYNHFLKGVTFLFLKINRIKKQSQHSSEVDQALKQTLKSERERSNGFVINY